jgi:hypothetical protein
MHKTFIDHILWCLDLWEADAFWRFQHPESE